jgi:hypothetical protein
VIENRVNRTKEERRRRLFAYQGNRQVIDMALGEHVFPRLSHPNRIMRRFRQSQRGNAA